MEERWAATEVKERELIGRLYNLVIRYKLELENVNFLDKNDMIRFAGCRGVGKNLLITFNNILTQRGYVSNWTPAEAKRICEISKAARMCR